MPLDVTKLKRLADGVEDLGKRFDAHVRMDAGSDEKLRRRIAAEGLEKQADMKAMISVSASKTDQVLARKLGAEAEKLREMAQGVRAGKNYPGYDWSNG